MNTLLLLLSLIILSSGITFLITHYLHKRKLSKLHICQFNSACTTFHQQHTTEAANRVVKLLIENIHEDTHYKKTLRNFISESSRGI